MKRYPIGEKFRLFMAVALGFFSIAAIIARLNAPRPPAVPTAEGIFAAGPERVLTTADPIISTPLVYGKLLIMRTTRQVYALDPETMSVMWEADAVGNLYDTAPPFIAGDYLIVPQYKQPLLAFKLQTGELTWIDCFQLEFDEEDCTGRPARTRVDALTGNSEVVILTALKGPLIAYDTSTGTTLWTSRGTQLDALTPVVDADIVYLDARWDGAYSVQAADLRTGRVLWKTDITGLVGNTAVSEDVVYVVNNVGYKDYVVAVSKDNGEILWQKLVSDVSVYVGDSLTVDGDLLFAAGNQLVAMNRMTGSFQWRVTGFRQLQSPVMFGDVILVRDDRLLFAFDRRTGSRLGRLSLETRPGSTNVELNAAVYGDLVLIPVGEKRIAVYRLESP